MPKADGEVNLCGEAQFAGGMDGDMSNMVENL